MFWNKGTKKQGSCYPEVEAVVYETKLGTRIDEEEQKMKQESTMYQIRRAFYQGAEVIQVRNGNHYLELIKWAKANKIECKDRTRVLVMDDMDNTPGLYAAYFPKGKTLNILKQDIDLKVTGLVGPLWAELVTSDAFLQEHWYPETKKGPRQETETHCDLVKKSGTRRVTIDGVQYEVQGSVTLEGKVVVK